MVLLKNIPFTFEGKKYEIRILYGDNTINIVAFYKNYPLNGFRHHIKIPQNAAPEKLLETDVLEEVLEISKNDITEKRWEKIERIF